jgi:predicted O-methyltransferase YrrM
MDNPYLNQNETRIVIELVKSVNPKTMIEFGCQMGRTSAAILSEVDVLERYIGIDVPADYVPTLAAQRSEVPSLPGRYALGDERFRLIIRPRGSLDLLPPDLLPCDAVFIDGDHSEQAVMHDSLLADALVRPGGIIIWHDYNNPTVEVTRALDTLIEAGWPIKIVKNTWLAYMGGNIDAE